MRNIEKDFEELKNVINKHAEKQVKVFSVKKYIPDFLFSQMTHEDKMILMVCLDRAIKEYVKLVIENEKED